MSYIIFPLFLWEAILQLSLMAVFGLTRHVGPWSKRLIENLQPRLCEGVRSQIIAISGGEEKIYDHPYREVLNTAEEVEAVLRKGEMGNVEIISDESQFWFETER